MVKPFKFLRTPLFTAHDGGEIYAGDVFYTMNKEVMGDSIPKYTIVRRCVHSKFANRFKPDHQVLWYFRSKNNAEWLREIWKRQDRESNIITSNR
jgi:hypothetical protein